MRYCEECGEAIREPGQRCWETGGQCFSYETQSAPGARGKVVSYKGHKYRMLWKGKTKFGERAHLQFLNGEKDFWCKASEVS
jgi:hypothetical protein